MPKHIFFHYFFGYFFIVLATIGMVLPVVPTVPFLLLALYFLNNVSQTMHKKIMNLPKFGPAIHSWQEDRVISVKTKVEVIILLSLSTGYILYFNDQINLLIKSVTVILMTLLATVVLKQKSKK